MCVHLASSIIQTPYSMGVSYTDGTLPKDPAAAAAWFKLAADQGDADGQVEMAKCFQAGPHMSNFSSL